MRFFGQVDKERGLAYVRGRGIPGESLLCRDRHRLPGRIAGEHVAVARRKELRRDYTPDDFAYLGGARPEVLEVHRAAAGVASEGLPEEVELHRPRQSERHDQRRGGPITSPPPRMDAALQVSGSPPHPAD